MVRLRRSILALALTVLLGGSAAAQAPCTSASCGSSFDARPGLVGRVVRLPGAALGRSAFFAPPVGVSFSHSSSFRSRTRVGVFPVRDALGRVVGLVLRPLRSGCR